MSKKLSKKDKHQHKAPNGRLVGLQMWHRVFGHVMIQTPPTPLGTVEVVVYRRHMAHYIQGKGWTEFKAASETEWIHSIPVYLGELLENPVDDEKQKIVNAFVKVFS